MRALHTPGPWRVSRDGNIRPASRDAKGHTNGYAPLAKIVGDKRVTTHENNAANARLMAAAPDLLEALKEILTCPAGDYDASDDYENAVKKANSAIAKATGEQ